MTEMTPEEVKQTQTDLLVTVDRWCRDHDCPYYLAYGTLLGAVRHQGYIPWDDDIDICMFRPDYERFIRTFNQDRTDDAAVLHTGLDPAFPYEFAKIHNRRTRLVEGVDYQYEIGVNIDLFVLDNLPRGVRDGKYMIGRMKLRKLLMEVKLLLVGNKKRDPIKQLVIRLAKLVGRAVPMRCLTRGMDRIAKRYEAQNDSKWVGDVCQRWFKPSEVLERRWFAEKCELLFEGEGLWAPAMYDEVLTAWYGDYMQLPPVEERVTHHSYRAYHL